ncbi:MAG: hypothetical protein ABSA63_09990 [Thermoplasmata archaeon]|jgi:hypothetical protein
MSKGKDLGKRVVRRSEDVGRDVKTGMSRAGTKLSKGAHTLGHDARRAGTKARAATERGWARARPKLSKGAHTLGRDARRAGTKTREVTERGWARASARLKRSRSA